MSSTLYMSRLRSGRRAMATFTFCIRDDRYSAPTMAFVIVEDEARAREFAARRLLESAHYTAIDVYEGEDLKFSV
jgi:hypothetical protein